MANLIRVPVLLFLVFCAAACTGEKTKDKKEISDETEIIKADPKETVRPAVEPVVKTISLESTMNCADARRIGNELEAEQDKRPLTLDEMGQLRLATVGRLSCAKPPKDERNILAINENGAELFTVDADPEKYAKACAAIASGLAKATGADIVTAGATGAYAAKVSCPSNIEAIANKDPLVILAPDFVQGRYLTKKVLTELAVYDDATKLGRKVEDFAKENAEKTLLLSAGGAVTLVAAEELKDFVRDPSGAIKSAPKRTEKELRRWRKKIF